MLRPVRDEMGIQAGVENMQWLFTGTFLVMLAVVPLFGYLLKKVPRRTLIPAIYLFFSLQIITFYLIFKMADSRVASVAFFIWLSVFNLFVVSVFWSFSSDIFRPCQAKRLFGPIAAGGSLGALLGPVLTTTLVREAGVLNLLLIAAFFLMASTWFVHQLLKSTDHRKREAMSRPIEGSTWGGLLLILKSRKLMQISAFILLYTTLSTFLYFQQVHIVSEAMTTPEARTAYFGLRDLLVNAFTLVIQCFFTDKIIRKWGMSMCLMVVPFVAVMGFLFLGINPSVYVLLTFQVAYRSLNFSLQRPAREMLFTSVSEEERYASKNFIDTAVYRGGDALGGWAFAILAPVVVSLPMLSFLAIPMAVLWVFSGRSIGRHFHYLNNVSYESIESLPVQKKSA